MMNGILVGLVVLLVLRQFGWLGGGAPKLPAVDAPTSGHPILDMILKYGLEAWLKKHGASEHILDGLRRDLSAHAESAVKAPAPKVK